MWKLLLENGTGTHMSLVLGEGKGLLKQFLQKFEIYNSQERGRFRKNATKNTYDH